jgi:hypothetical protein
MSVSADAPFPPLRVPPRLQRSLAVVYRFYDVFFDGSDAQTPLIRLPLEVAIPSLRWRALHVMSDHTYRFSWATLTQPLPSNTPSPPLPASFSVTVNDPSGQYAVYDDPASLAITLPLPLSTPPKAADFAITKPLWPTPSFRPPAGETVVRGSVRSPTAQSVADLKVEIWLGPSPTPPAGTPFTRTTATGDFLYRLPLLKGSPGDTLTARLQLNGGALAVTPTTLPIVIGQSRILSFLRP